MRRLCRAFGECKAMAIVTLYGALKLCTKLGDPRVLKLCNMQPIELSNVCSSTTNFCHTSSFRFIQIIQHISPCIHLRERFQGCEMAETVSVVFCSVNFCKIAILR